MAESLLKWLPLFAVAISVLSLILTFRFNSQQNVKWNKLNQPRIKLKSIFFQRFAVYEPEKVLPNLGYVTPLLFTGIEDGRQVATLLNDLVLWNPTTGSYVIGAKRMLTMADCQSEAVRLNLANIEVKKRLQLKVGFLNAGQLSAYKVATNIEFLINKDGVQNPSWQGTPPIAELAADPRWPPQNRPCMATSKPAI